MSDGTYHTRRNDFKALEEAETGLAHTAQQRAEAPGFFTRAAQETFDVAVRAPIHGINRAGEEFVQWGYDTLDWLDDAFGVDAIDGDWQADFGSAAWKPRTTVGNIVSPVAQFLTGFAATGGVMKAAGLAGKLAGAGKAAQYTATAAQGAVTDAVFFDPHEERLSNLIEQVPALRNPLTEYLAARDGDSRAEGRFKNAVEGILVGFAVDSFIAGIKGIKQWRSVPNKLEMSPDQLAEAHSAIFGGVGKTLENDPSVVLKEAPAPADEALRDGLRNLSEQADGILNAPSPAEAIRRTESVIGSIRSAAELNGVDIERPLRELSNVLSAVVEGTRSPQDLAEAVKKNLSLVDELIGTPPAQRTVLARTVGDISPQELVERFVKSKKSGEPLRDFIPTTSLRNNIESPDDVVRLFQAVEDADSFVRDPKLGTTQSLDVVREEAARMIGETARRSDLDVSMPAFMRAFGDDADKIALKVCMSEAYMDDIAARCASYASSLVDLSQEAVTPSLTRDGAALLRLFGTVSAHYDRIQTGVGRGLQAFKSRGSVDIAEILNTARGMSLEDTIKAQGRSIDLMSPQEILAALNKASALKDKRLLAIGLLPDSATGKLFVLSNEFWINSILSGPVTHFVNVVSGLMKVGVMQPAEKMLGGGIGYLRNTIRGDAHAAAESLTVWNEGLRAWAGLCYGLSDAWRIAKASFSVGNNILKPGNSVIEEQVRTIAAQSFNLSADEGFGKTVEHFGRAVNLPTRFMVAEDEFVSQLAYRQHLFTKLYAKADDMYARGLLSGDKAKAISGYIDREFDKHFFDVTLANGKEIPRSAGVLQSGLNEATDATFTQPLSEGFQQNFQKLINESPAARRLIAPFVRTPINIFKDAVAHTPLFARTLDSYKAAIKEGGRAAAIARGKEYLGTMIWTTTAMLAANGNITGSGPKDYKQRAALLETGWRPFSFKVGDSYVSYDRIEPFATILGIGADLVDILSEIDEDDAATAKETGAIATQALFSVLNTVGSKTFMRGFADFTSAWSSEEGAATYLKNFVVSYNPALFVQMRKVADPELREVRGVLDAFRDRFPFLSQSLPAKFSWLTGEPLRAYGRRMAGISPIVMEKAANNPVAAELVRLGAGSFAPPRRIGGVPLTAEQYSDLTRLNGTVKIRGKTLMQALESLIASRAYDVNRERTPDSDDPTMGPRYQAVAKLIKEYRQAATQKLYKEHPVLADQLLGSQKRGPNSVYRDVVRATGRTKQGSIKGVAEY